MNDTQSDIGKLIEPAQVSFSFDTPGWYAAGIALIILLLVILLLIWRNYQKNKYRREALQYLTALETNLSGSQLTYETNMILKRIALRFCIREQVASLRNEEWISFLNTTGKAGLFPDETTKLLNDIYSQTDTQPKAFVQNARTWVKVHTFRKTKLKVA